MKENPREFLLEAMCIGASNAIEAQEARGQRDFVASESIPTKLLHGTTEEQLTTLGFVLGDTDPRDPVFRAAAFPEGWSKQATDHSMWSRIVDEKGRKRASVFFKAAFYDYDAHLILERRLSCCYDYSDANCIDGKRTDERCFVFDADESKLFASTSTDYHDSRAECEAWLKANYPDWENPLAYWSELPVSSVPTSPAPNRGGGSGSVATVQKEGGEDPQESDE